MRVRLWMLAAAAVAALGVLGVVAPVDPDAGTPAAAAETRAADGDRP